MSQDPRPCCPPKERKPTRPTFKLGSTAAPVPEGASTGFQKASAFAQLAVAGDSDAVEGTLNGFERTGLAGLGAFAFDEAVAGVAESKFKLKKVKKQARVNELEDESLEQISEQSNGAKDDAHAAAKKERKKTTKQTLVDEIENELSKRLGKDGDAAENGALGEMDKKKRKSAKRRDSLKLDKKPTARQPRKGVDKNGDTTEAKVPSKRAKAKAKEDPTAATLQTLPAKEAIAPLEFVFKAFRLPGSLATHESCTPQAVEDPTKLAAEIASKPVAMENSIPAAHPAKDGTRKDHVLAAEQSVIDATPRVAIEDFQACYGYTDNARLHNAEPTAKRPRLDPEQLSFKKPAIPVTAAKPRSAPKKPLTITARAISLANQTSEDTGPNFDAGDDVRKQDIPSLGLKHNQPKMDQPEKQKITEPEKKPKRKKKATMPEPPKPRKLPSPRSAMKRMEALDLMFGTSSQIKADDTQYLLDLQEAVHASEAESQELQEVLAPEQPAAADQPARKLWSVSARDDKELLLLPESPEQRRRARQLSQETEPVPAQQPEDKPAEAFKAEPKGLASPDDEYLDIDAAEVESKIAAPAVAVNPTRPTARLKLPSTKLKSCLKLLKVTPSIPAGGAAGVLTPISPNKLLLIWENNTSAANEVGTARESPKSDNQENHLPTLNTPASGKPKAPKKKRTAQTSAGSNVTATDADDEPAKKKRGRPKKGSSVLETGGTPSTATNKRTVKRKKAGVTVDEYQAIEDIEDDIAPSPSPPRRTSPSKLAQLEMSQSLAQEVAEANKDKRAKEEAYRQVKEALRIAEEAEAKLFAKITSTVKSEPRSTDLKTPNWFEKILLYDPIVLEDLTAWLNGKGFRTASDDKELKATLVQKWCESNSICCLWREGLRGGVKKRY